MSRTRRDSLWVVAGVLAIAHVVLMLGSFALQRVAPLGASSAVVVTDHVTWSMSKGMGGGYLTAVSFLVFLVEASLLSTLLRGTTDQTRWCASALAGSGVVYVAATFAALANLGGALYVGHHHADVATVTALVDVHWFAVYVAILSLGSVHARHVGRGPADRCSPPVGRIQRAWCGGALPRRDAVGGPQRGHVGVARVVRRARSLRDTRSRHGESAGERRSSRLNRQDPAVQGRWLAPQ